MSRRARTRWVIAVLLLVVGWLAASSVVAYVATHRLRARADELVPNDLASSTRTVRIATRDGEDLGAWWIAGRRERPVVVVLHGLGGGRSAVVHKARLLAARGFGVLAVSLRAHGDSSGERVDFGWSSKVDVVSAVEWIARERPDARIAIDGASMGAAAALFATQELGARVSCYVIECPYRDLETAIDHRLDEMLPPVLDSIAWAGLHTVAPIFLPDLERISPWAAASGLSPTQRVLVLASRADTKARPEEARDLVDRIGRNASITWFETAPHDRLVETDEALWLATVVPFLESEPSSAPNDR